MTLHFPNDVFTIGASAAEGDLCPKCSGTFDANGFCTEDGSHYEPAADTDNNGVYEIGNAGQLYWFMEHVNEGGEQADTDAVLTANIIVNENVLNEDGTLNGDGSGFREWFPIGFCYDLNEDGNEEEVSYTGTLMDRDTPSADCISTIRNRKKLACLEVFLIQVLRESATWV